MKKISWRQAQRAAGVKRKSKSILESVKSLTDLSPEDAKRFYGVAKEVADNPQAMGLSMPVSGAGKAAGKAAGLAAKGAKSLIKKIQKPDFVDQIIKYESGEMANKEAIKFLWTNKDKLRNLQGHYGRAIAELEYLVKSGQIKP